MATRAAAQPNSALDGAPGFRHIPPQIQGA